MRIVEPKHFNHQTGITKKRPYKKIGLVMSVTVLIAAGIFYSVSSGVFGSKQIKNPPASPPQESAVIAETSEEQQPAVSEDESPKLKKLRIFADNDFKNFYDQVMLPNLSPVENPPVISGNDVADARIRQIAESRGYRLRSSPVGSLSSVDGQPMQPSVIGSWKGLKAAAASAGLQMSIVSAYRSVENQRSLFLSRLSATGATIEQVAAGNADDKVNTVLITSSIPGYSKHHTGYTLDLQCAGWEFENFKNSPCNAWITADNYKFAKENGFIPSYPPAADIQGPDPEAWEYVWVGTEHLYE